MTLSIFWEFWQRCSFLNKVSQAISRYLFVSDDMYTTLANNNINKIFRSFTERLYAYLFLYLEGLRIQNDTKKFYIKLWQVQLLNSSGQLTCWQDWRADPLNKIWWPDFPLRLRHAVGSISFGLYGRCKGSLYVDNCQAMW